MGWNAYYRPINSAKRFLRGGLEKDVLNLEEDSIEQQNWSFQGSTSIKDQFFWTGGCPSDSSYIGPTPSGTCGHCASDQFCQKTSHIAISDEVTVGTGGETKPKNMNVVFIMKIK